MTDFCITAVRYSTDRKHINYVQVGEEKSGSIGTRRTVERAFVADLIRLGKASFQTRIKKADGLLYVGAHVHLIDNTFLTTDKNGTERDNLGSLPEF